MTLATLHGAVLFVAVAVFIAAAMSDARSYLIPNYTCGLLLLMFPLFVATSPFPVEWVQNVIVFGLVAVLGFVVFMTGQVGAGDIKFFSVASLWAGPQLIAVLVFVTALMGGLLSLVVLFALYVKRSKANENLRLIKTPVPYGIAIAIGGLSVLGKLAQPILLPG